MDVYIPNKFLEGTVQLPASKSFLHRALIAASLAEEETIIRNITISEDISDTIHCLRQLGAEIKISNVITVKPAKWKNNLMRIRESGTTYRFLIPILSAFFDTFEIEVADTLYKRPLTIYEEMGMTREGKDHTFSLKPGEYYIDGSISSQFVSGLLFALPLLDGDSVLHVDPVSSENYIKMTIDVLRDFGIKVDEQNHSYYIKGNQSFKACDYTVEPDFSACAFWAVAGTINGDILVEAPKFSHQPDFEIIRLLNELTELEYEDGFKFKKQSFEGFEFDVDQCPDLAPSLAVLAMFANSPSTIKGIDRLRIKESDRVDGILKLRAFGAQIEMNGDIKITPNTYHDGVIAQSDHRIAMMAAIVPVNKKIINMNSINKSYPGFIQDYELLGGTVEDA